MSLNGPSFHVGDLVKLHIVIQIYLFGVQVVRTLFTSWADHLYPFSYPYLPRSSVHVKGAFFGYEYQMP